MHGGHLTLSDRQVLARRQARGEHPSDIAQEFGCHVRAIYRELGRNASAGQYYPARAQALGNGRAKRAHLGLEIDFADRPTMRISPQGPV